MGGLMNGRGAILFAAPGTTCPEARVSYDTIARDAARRFQGVEQRWTFTSAGVRRKLAEQGQPVRNPAEQLAAMRTEGFTHVAVLSLHLTDGMEFNELAEAVGAVNQLPGNQMHTTLGLPLLTDETDWKRALAAIKAGLPALYGQHERVILIAHGSREARAIKTLEAAGRLCRSFDSRFILRMMIGKPGLGEVVGECEQEGVKKVWLLPCMVTAGYSARDEMTGPGDESWAATLARSHIETIPIIQGLGENEGIVSIWMDRLGRLMADWVHE
jgi:sirohydrochlorin cobaltochelatase